MNLKKNLWKTPLKVRGRQALGECLPPAIPNWGELVSRSLQERHLLLYKNIQGKVRIWGIFTGLIWQYVRE